MDKAWSTELLSASLSPKCVNRDKKLSKLVGGSMFPKTSPYFRGNKLLRSSIITFKYTNEEKISLYKIKSDSKYLCELVGIVPRDFQNELLNNLYNNRFNLIIKSRQSGTSTICAVEALSYSYNCDKAILIISDRLDNAKRIISIILYLYKSLPFYAKLGIRSYSEKEIRFENGTLIRAATFHNNSHSAYSMNYDFTIVDNFAYLDKKSGEAFLKSLYPIIYARVDSRLTILSSPNGDNLFKELVFTKNIFNKQWIYYYQIPGRDNEWINNEISKIGELAFMQEYELIFSGTKEWNRRVSLSKLDLK